MERAVVRITSLVAFAIVLATDILYIALINSQDSSDDMPYVPRFVASYLALLAALIALALVPRPEMEPLRFPMRAAAAAGLFGVGILASMSIGLPLVVAGILVGVALGRTKISGASAVRRLAGVAAAVLSLAVGVVGLDVASRVIVCPEVGTSGGGGMHLLGGSYEYTCNNGELRMTSG